MILRLVFVLMAGVLAFVAHHEGERAGNARTVGHEPDDLFYLPTGRYLRMASLGHRNFVADLVWLHAIQYYGEQRLTTQTYDQAERLFQVIYDLDATFKGATRFGALVLAQDAGNPDGALQLLRRAAVDNPEAWEYAFDQGFILHTVKNEFEAAGNAYRRASQLPDAPTVAARLAGLSFSKLDDRSASREVWQAIHDEAENDMMRSLAIRNLKNLHMEDTQDRLADAVSEFREKHGRLPANWDEVLRGTSLNAVPEEPFGGVYYIEAQTGLVWATTHVDRRMAQARDIIRGFVDQIHAKEGAFPKSIEEVVDRGHIPSAPWEPFGLGLEYDPTNGRVSWSPPWAATEPRTHGEGVG